MIDKTLMLKAKFKIAKWIVIASLGFIVLCVMSLGGAFKIQSDKDQQSNSGGTGNFNVAWNTDLPKDLVKDIKGKGQINDQIAQLAVATAIKYKQLPSIILSQYAYESMWGQSGVAQSDNNYFGITWFQGSKYPQGSARGIGGSEGGNYMKFPSAEECFNYYGYMIASQSNFNQAVGEKDPSKVLLILGRGGYASAGITESSPYFTSAMSIIESNHFKDYDKYAIDHWDKSSAIKPLGEIKSSGSGSSSGGSTASLPEIEKVLGQTVENGQCYGLTAYYVKALGGPQMMGTGHAYASMIGSDYNWSAYGFEVISNPKVSDLKAGDIFNCQGLTGYAVSEYGHTGIVIKVNSDGTYDTYEQNAERGQIVAKYTRQASSYTFTSIVRKK